MIQWRVAVSALAYQSTKVMSSFRTYTFRLLLILYETSKTRTSSDVCRRRSLLANLKETSRTRMSMDGNPDKEELRGQLDGESGQAGDV